MLLAPLYASLLLALIPKRLRGLRAAVMVAGIACNMLMVCAAFYYGVVCHKNSRKASFVIRTGSNCGGDVTGPPPDDELTDAEHAWNRDSGAM